MNHCQIKRFFYIVFTFITVFIIQAQNLKSPSKIKKVLKKPYNYEYLSNPLTSNSSSIEKPWVVYSDRKDNVVFADAKLSRAASKVQYLDSFYVAKVSGEAFELIKYNSGILKTVNAVIDPGKVEYVGWMDRSHLVLTDRCMSDAKTKVPVKYVTMVNGRRIFDNIKKHASGDRLKVYSDPEFVSPIDSQVLYFNEVVYVYRQYKDRMFIGKSKSFSTKDAKKVVLGWVHTDFLQSWGTRLCIEPSLEKDAPAPLLYPSKQQALNYKANAPVSYELKRKGCDLGEQLWERSPVFDIEYVNKEKIDYKIFKTGVVLNPFDKSDGYIYNVNGSKLNYTKLCDMVASSKKTNIIFAVNMSNDTKEYFPVLVNTLQDLSNLFGSKNGIQTIKFGAVNCATGESTDLKTTFSAILPSLMNITKESVENKKAASSSAILNGLYSANRLFKGHEYESNIIVFISSQGDEAYADPNYKARAEKIADDLARSNARMLFFQPYCGNGSNYSSFVQQAKMIIKRSSERISIYKKDRQVGNNLESVYNNNFKSLFAGANNVYCLDFPENAISQGFIVFPTIGNKTEGKFLNNAIDSLMLQMDLDNKYLIKSVSAVFNSPSLFNNKINKSFVRYYSAFESIPEETVYNQLKNMNYNYFANGYTIVPTKSNFKYFKQSLFLSEEEYNELYDVFKSLKFDLVALQYDEASRIQCYKALDKTIEVYAAKKGSNISTDITLGRFFYEICGHTSYSNSLNTFRVKDMSVSQMSLNRDYFKSMIDEVNLAFQKYYSLRNNDKYVYYSQGKPYYWVTEDFLP